MKFVEVAAVFTRVKGDMGYIKIQLKLKVHPYQVYSKLGSFSTQIRLQIHFNIRVLKYINCLHFFERNLEFTFLKYNPYFC